MRFHSYVNGGYGFKGIDLDGGMMTMPLKLVSVPTGEMDAVTRSYVDESASSFDASVISGKFDSARLPGFTGVDFTAGAGGAMVLKPSGVTAGVYGKVTVNKKGLVTAGAGLTADDIPTLNWSKVSGKPTTLSGYGITDVVSLNGGVMTGPLNLTMTPSASVHLANKAYVDSKVGTSTGSAFVTGDIVFKSSSVVPSGFLRCNGGDLSKSVYAGLYAVMGDKYAPAAGNPGAGKPWKNSYAFDTNPTTTIGAWTTSASLPARVYYSQAIVTKNRVYFLGGLNSSTVYTAPINPDGTLGAWTTSTSLPFTVGYSQAIVIKNRVYLLGGVTNDSPSSTVYTAPINPDGTLGAWTTSTSLPATVYHPEAIVTKNRVYLLGGHTGSLSSSAVYTAPINPDGTLGTWTTSNSLPATVTAPQAIVTNNRVYLLGGHINSISSSTVYTAPINPDGTLGAWTTANSLPATVYGSQAIVTKNRVYLLGGVIDGSHSSTVYTAPINSDGTLGTWTTSNYLPATVYGSQAIVTKNRVYLLGSSSSAVLHTAPITAGLNDYSPLYDGSYTVVDPNNFRLPDLTLTDKPGSYSYIKF